MMKGEDRIGALPRNWERAFGYDGEARYVAFYWAPVGDDAMYDNGRVSGDGNWQMFLFLRYENRDLGRRYNLGHSEVEADHWLLLDRKTRDLVVLPKEEARARLRRQWPVQNSEPNPTAFDWKVIQEAVGQAVHNVEAAMEQIQPCDTCFYSVAPGWLQAEDGGFDCCPVCQGLGFLGTAGGTEDPGVPGSKCPGPLGGMAATNLHGWQAVVGAKWGGSSPRRVT